MRENRVRTSDEEYEMLKDYRDREYPNTPLGAVVKILLEKNE